MGLATVADLNLPEEFLRRVADRVIRSSYQQTFRMVVGESGQSGEPGAVAPEPPPAAGKASAIKVKTGPAPAKVRGYRDGFPEAVTLFHGYRAPLLEEAGDLWPSILPSEDEALMRGVPIVAARLAAEGFLPTLLHTVVAIGPAGLGNRAQREKNLRRVGLPMDLLPHFEGGETVLDRIGAAIEGDSSDPTGATPRTNALLETLTRTALRFTQSVPGFRIQSETGEQPTQWVRVHATRAEYWGGVGAGSSLDVIRQLAGLFPETRMIVSADQAIAPDLAKVLATWPKPARFTIATGFSPVSQWAQDNGKAGSAKGKALLLVPRYASRGEHDTTLVPGDTFIVDAMEACGVPVAQSPLLFQGGNISAFWNRETGVTTLLVGEGEVCRNMRLGLTREQATEALRVEFGAEKAVVLPAASFHVDFEFSLRLHEGKLLAFVNDTGAAIRLIVKTGAEALLNARLLTPQEQTRLKWCLTRLLPIDIVPGIGPILNRLASGAGAGAFPVELTKHFSTAPWDSGVGNFQTFLLALDLLAAELLPAHRPPDRHLRAYIESFPRRDADRRRLWRMLEGAGLTLVRVPSMADGERSLNYVNGLHEPDRYLMPAHGGLYKALDEAAAGAFRQALGGGAGVEVVPVLCAETQRRSGGLHCAVSLI